MMKLPQAELHLRRLTVDEALSKLEQFLNDSYVAGLSVVLVVHGKGTGTLREEVRRELTRHPLVKSFRPGWWDEGGAGVTMVELSDR